MLVFPLHKSSLLCSFVPHSTSQINIPLFLTPLQKSTFLCSSVRQSTSKINIPLFLCSSIHFKNQHSSVPLFLCSSFHFKNQHSCVPLFIIPLHHSIIYFINLKKKSKIQGNESLVFMINSKPVIWKTITLKRDYWNFLQ